MSQDKVILATTEVIDGVMLTRESLVYAAATINGEKAPRQIVDHDPCSIPLGKARAAEVVDIGKTAALLVIPDETHRVATSIHEPSGIPIVEITYPHDNRPFVLHPAGKTDAAIAVEVDLANFDSFEDIKAFQDLAEQNGANEKTSLMGRRSLTPEPLIQFLISDPVLASVLIWALRRGERFLTYTVDATARKAGDAISDTISARLRSWLENFNRHRSQDDRAVTSQIIVNVDPQIILITTGQHTEQQTDIGIQSLTKHLELWESLLHKADSITFVRESKNEEWIFLHMTTSDGKVIAAEDSYLRTITRREDIARTKPVCVYLKHKVTGEERHHETTAVFTKVDEAGRFEVKFNSFPQDLEHWEITGYSLLSDTRTTPNEPNS